MAMASGCRLLRILIPAMAAGIASPSSVSANDRFTFAVFLALVLHGLLLTIEFDFEPPSQASMGLEITLARFKADKAPEKADFLAQNNQEGSGTEKDKLAPSTREMAPFADNRVNPFQPVEQVASQPVVQPQKRVVTTQGRSRDTAAAVIKETTEITEERPESQVSLWQRSLEIASLEAELREQQQTHARRPRKRQLTAASAREARDAYYLDGWRQKVETVGNLNYPAEARRRQIFGRLRMMVAVKADGSLHEVRVMQSSGYKVLDDAALRIVQLAAPFQPFPPDLRKDTDILEIVRTWQFEKGNYVSSF